MSHFYGTLTGGTGESTRCATKKTGLTAVAASWKGAISVRIYHEEATGRDKFEICQREWQGAGVYEPLAYGTLGLTKEGDEE